MKDESDGQQRSLPKTEASEELSNSNSASVDGEERIHPTGTFSAKIGRIWNATKSLLKRNRRRVATFLVAVLASVVGALMLSFFMNTNFRPYIAVIASKASVDFTIPKEFVQGFDSRDEKIETADGNPVEIMTFEDFGSVAEARQLAERCVEDERCVLVVGNSDSTVTTASLDIFLQAEDRPSYILPIATANSIMKKAQKADYDAILRMVPENSKQAEEVQRLVASLSPSQRVAVYSDEENPTYSKDLSRDIVRNIRAKDGSILVEEMIGPSNSLYSSLEIWRGEYPKPPDVIVYVGVAHHALLLIDQVRELGITAPIVFTDGCMVTDLLKNLKKIRNRTFVLSPVGSGNKGDPLPTYKPIGADAFTLAKRIIAKCQKCDRAEVRSVVAGIRNSGVFLADGNAGEYSFDADGNNRTMPYKVYEVTGGTIRIYNKH